MASKLDQAEIFQESFDEPSKSLKIKSIASLVSVEFDSISKTNTDSITETFQYYLGGLAGTLVATVTIIYTDSTKEDMVSAVRT